MFDDLYQVHGAYLPRSFVRVNIMLRARWRQLPLTCLKNAFCSLNKTRRVCDRKDSNTKVHAIVL